MEELCYFNVLMLKLRAISHDFYGHSHSANDEIIIYKHCLCECARENCHDFSGSLISIMEILFVRKLVGFATLELDLHAACINGNR